jgi:hypothetical protein
MNFPANSSQSTQERSWAIRSAFEGKAMSAFSGPSFAINWLIFRTEGTTGNTEGTAKTGKNIAVTQAISREKKQKK